MTIGIGVLCSTYPNYEQLPGKPRPDALVMAADTMGSTETDSTDAVHKIHENAGLGVYCVSANSLASASELFSTICHVLSGVSERTHGAMWNAISEAVNGHRAERFRWDVLSPR